MFQRVNLIGRGRVGSAVADRLRERGVPVTEHGGDLVLLCVPDRAIREVAAGIRPGPWVAHVSGATALAALAPHVRRFSLHPLQTFAREGGAAQFDGAWAALSGETADAMACGRRLADVLGLRAFELRDDARVLYHAGASVASNFLVTLYRAAARLLDQAGAPPEALIPLMRRTIDNGFDLTGPIARGDWDVVEAHLHAIRTHAPDLEAMYRALAEATRR
jgi:predicted short-subunit dehydrogenase-like oxidoreductase (DUF2520 family)